MPFPMKIQPIDRQIHEEGSARLEQAKPVVKSRLKRLFERPFHGVLRNSAAERVAGEEVHLVKDVVSDCGDFEPSSVCLAKMVENFMEENNNQEKQSSSVVRCGRNRCNCFNGNGDDSSDDDYDVFGSFSESNHSSSDVPEILKVK